MEARRKKNRCFDEKKDVLHEFKAFVLTRSSDRIFSHMRYTGAIYDV